jgi:hypothetical protein
MNALDWFHDTIYIVQFICDREYDCTVFELAFFSNASHADVKSNHQFVSLVPETTLPCVRIKLSALTFPPGLFFLQINVLHIVFYFHYGRAPLLSNALAKIFRDSFLWIKRILVIARIKEQHSNPSYLHPEVCWPISLYFMFILHPWDSFSQQTTRGPAMVSSTRLRLWGIVSRHTGHFWLHFKNAQMSIWTLIRKRWAHHFTTYETHNKTTCRLDNCTRNVLICVFIHCLTRHFFKFSLFRLQIFHWGSLTLYTDWL